ncbi:uncharacterized protein [Littorina saxatilis]|uniref:uncharacterized protein n=1 Tax=Littorina saxatilis TaxID=31220 RepID=UPI0038B49191
MSVFARRSSGYKAGVILHFMGCILFIVGFSSPNWTAVSVSLVAHYPVYDPMPMASLWPGGQMVRQGHQGLWSTCMQDNAGHMKCEPAGDKTHDWFLAVRALQCLGMIGLVASSCYVIMLNWVKDDHVHNRLVEIVAGASGLLGLIGTIAYAVNTTVGGNSPIWPGQLVDHWTDYYPQYATSHVSWALAVDLCGCLLSTVAAIIVAAHNKALLPLASPTAVGPPPHSPTDASNSYIMTTRGAPPPHPPPPQASFRMNQHQPPQTSAPSVRVFVMPSTPDAVAPASVPGPPAYEAQYPMTVGNQALSATTTSAFEAQYPTAVGNQAAIAPTTPSYEAQYPTAVGNQAPFAATTPALVGANGVSFAELEELPVNLPASPPSYTALATPAVESKAGPPTSFVN